MKTKAFFFYLALAGAAFAQTIPGISVIQVGQGTGGGGGGGSGTVTSVDVTTANGVSATGGPITGAGSFTFSLGAITPTSVAIGSDPADAGSIRLDNAALIAWEASPAGTDVTMTVNSAEQFVFSNAILSPDIATSITTASTSFTAFAGATTLLTIGGTGASASLFAPSTLDTSSSTTGAIRTSGGISAAKAANIGTTVTAGTSVISPIFSSSNADPADAGTIRLGNAELIEWEASPAGADVSLTVNSSEQFVFSNTILSPDVTTSITTPSSTIAVFNATATTVNAFGAATTLNVGNASGSNTILGITALNGATPSASTSLIVPAGSTSVSSLRLPHGVAPTSPVNGDMWTTTSGLNVRVNGSTQLLASASVPGSDTQVIFNDSAAFGADAGMTYNKTTDVLTLVGGVTTNGAATGIVTITGSTSGSLKITTADATAQVLTVSGAAQTSGAATATIPDLAGVNSTFSFVGKAETLSGVKTFSAAPVLGAGVGMKLTVPTVDGTSTGPTTNEFNCGYSSSAVGDLVYLDSSSTWQKCDANTTALYSGLLGIALEVKASGAALNVALPGSFVYATGFPTLTVGGACYMSETPGAITQTAPVTTDSATRIIGWAIHADKIFFAPQQGGIITHT